MFMGKLEGKAEHEATHRTSGAQSEHAIQHSAPWTVYRAYEHWWMQNSIMCKPIYTYT